MASLGTYSKRSTGTAIAGRGDMFVDTYSKS